MDGERATVEQFDATGSVTGRAELPITTEAFDERAWGARRARDLAAIARPRDSAKVIAMYDPSIRPARAPAFVRALGGANGELWLERFKLDDTTPREFVVVSGSARVIGAVTIPRWLDVQQVGADFVLGIRRTIDGIESIVELPLKRGPVR